MLGRVIPDSLAVFYGLVRVCAYMCQYEPSPQLRKEPLPIKIARIAQRPQSLLSGRGRKACDGRHQRVAFLSSQTRCNRVNGPESSSISCERLRVGGFV